jgi:hypothetical protein
LVDLHLLEPSWLLLLLIVDLKCVFNFVYSFEAKTCQLDIKLPLVTESEVGRWRIDLGFGNDDFTGCYFTLPENESKFSFENKRSVLLIKFQILNY